MSQLPPGFQLDGPASSAPVRAPGIIQGRPKAPDPVTPVQAAQLDMEAERLRIAQQKASMEATEFQQKQAKQNAGIPRDMGDVRAELINVIGKAGQARRKSNEWFATGLGANTAGSFGGTNAADVQALLDSIGGNIAFDRLARMRAESPTGGALGNVTEMELKLLQSTVASLDKAQSDEQFRKSMDDVIRSYGRVLAKLPGTEPGAVLDEMLKGGASFEELEALAGGMGFELDRETVLANIRSRDEGGPTSNFTRDPNDPNGGGGIMPTGEQFQQGIAQGVGDIVQGVGDTVGMITDPFGRVLADALGYDGSQMQSLGAVAREGAGLPQNQNKTAGAINRFAASGLVGGLAARAAAPLAQAGGVAQNALATIGRTPVRDAVAGAGAGAGSQIGQEVGGTPGAIAGGLLGGIGGYGAANALARAAAPRQANALMQEAGRLGVEMLPADAGGTATRMATGAVGRTFGGIPIAEGALASTESAGRAARQIADRVGDVADRTGAGQAARRGFNRFEESSLKRGNDLYEKVSVPAEQTVSLRSTRTALEEVTRGFKSNPELSKLWTGHPRLKATLEALTPEDVAGPARKEFMSLSSQLADAQVRLNAVRNSTTATPADKAEIASTVEGLTRQLQAVQRNTERMPVGGELSWEDMSRFRSIVGEIVGQPSMTSDGADIAAVRKLYAAISSDMEATAIAQGGKAAQEWKRATQYWRGRQGRIDDVFATLLGPDGKRGEEKVFNQINAWASGRTGDFGRLAKTIRSMPKDEADTIRATIVNEMGKAPPARQSGQAGDVFSAAEFAKQWQGLSPRAKSVLFPDRQHRADLEALARITEQMRAASQYQNFSNTALGANFTATTMAGVSGIPGMMLAGAYSGVSYGFGKLLASPGFARLLARTAKMPPEAANRTFREQLGVLATREPALQGDITTLLQAVNDNSRRVAAEDQGQN